MHFCFYQPCSEPIKEYSSRCLSSLLSIDCFLDELFKGYYNLIFFIEKKRNIPFCLFLWEDALIFDDDVVGVIVVIVIIVWMGSGLCPGATKDIIQ